MPLDRDALATDAILAPPRSRDLFRSPDDAAAARLVRRFIAVLDVDRLAGRIRWWDLRTSHHPDGMPSGW